MGDCGAMRIRALRLARHRLALALPVVAILTLVAQPAAADPPGDVNAAKQNLQHAQSQASATDRALAGAKAQLANALAQLAGLQQHIAALDATIQADTSSLARLQAQLATDRARLAAYLRQIYEYGGSEADLAYIVSSSDIATAIQRKVQLDSIANAGRELVRRIDDEAAQAQHTLDSDNVARAQLAVAEEQARTTEALVAVQTQQVQDADVAAHAQVATAKGALNHAQAALAAWIAAAQANGTVFSPIDGARFTIDTDLTKPSGETAAKLNNFLQNTTMAGLGDSFMRAEQTYHVSARYFVAHAILESAWGTSAIARDKHNLFGFNANDSNPYGNATNFPSFDACIQYVAHVVQVEYLSPNGPYYHGPTLRGMNVKYASDPNWATKIASIARTIP
jgi:beta-N-acetylglucosaminidase